MNIIYITGHWQDCGEIQTKEVSRRGEKDCVQQQPQRKDQLARSKSTMQEANSNDRRHHRNKPEARPSRTYSLPSQTRGRVKGETDALLGIFDLYNLVWVSLMISAKGKIEKFFLKVRRSFLEPILELTPPNSIDKLNKAFFEWAESEYNHRTHSAFKATPIRRFMESSSHMRCLPDKSKTLFHVQCCRRVKKDGTFSLDGTRFETVPALAGCKITLSYDLRENQIIFVYWQDKYYGKANLLDPKVNCTRLYRRNNNKTNGDKDNA